jgi:hypothetical protein
MVSRHQALLAGKAAAALAALALLSGCATGPVSRGFERVRLMWIEDNQRVLEQEGTRTIRAAPAACLEAAREALRRIGLMVTAEDRGSGQLVAERPNSPGDISEAVQAAELPRVRQIMEQELGQPFRQLSLAEAQGVLQATLTVAPADDGSTMSLRLCNGDRDASGVVQVARCVIPTAQYRAGLNEFWQAFEAVLGPVPEASAQRAPSAPARATRRTERPKPSAKQVRPPSEWVLPD